MSSYHQTITPEARDRLAAYARKVAAALTQAGHEPPEQMEYGYETEYRSKFPFGKEAVSVPYRRCRGRAWQLFQVKRFGLMKSVDMTTSQRRQENEHAGLMWEDYYTVLWLGPTGEIQTVERVEIRRTYVTPQRIDVYFKESEYWGDPWSLPDYFTELHDDKKQAMRAGYHVWEELRQPRLRYDKFGIGLSLALKQLAANHGVELTPRRSQSGGR
ncbi:MAG: hypothetical protein M1274_03955 [Actinobacteria bacterium]|nr:hypothetical protein [Actinomycetota bacterium]